MSGRWRVPEAPKYAGMALIVDFSYTLHIGINNSVQMTIQDAASPAPTLSFKVALRAKRFSLILSRGLFFTSERLDAIWFGKTCLWQN